MRKVREMKDKLMAEWEQKYERLDISILKDFIVFW